MSIKLTDSQLQQLAKIRLWGAATSAHQVEGGTVNQWSGWEQKHAAGRAEESAEQFDSWLPDWDDIRHEAQKSDNYISGGAADHYNRYEEDFEILSELNANAYRFSIEWSRIEPQEGEWSEGAIEHYRRYIAALRKRNIEPVVTLWHWTTPVWFEDRGGFSSRKNVSYFVRFCERVMSELGDSITYVCILNEPNVYAVMSHLMKRWPPQSGSPLRFARVYLNLVRAQKAVYRSIASEGKKIGLAYAVSHVETVTKNPVAQLIAAVVDYGWNVWFLARIKNHYDFIGVNHYFTNFISWKGEVKKHERRSDYGWHMNPIGIADALKTLDRRFGAEIIITENGLADRKDQYREWWIEQTMIGLSDALEAGVHITGYLHWSLLDNFEWAEGFWPRFGLVAVDRANQKRTIRSSAHSYAEVIAQARLANKQ